MSQTLKDVRRETRHRLVRMAAEFGSSIWNAAEFKPGSPDTKPIRVRDHRAGKVRIA